MISAGSEIAHQDGIDRKPVLQMDSFTYVRETDSVTRAWHQLIYLKLTRCQLATMCTPSQFRNHIR
jgi:hypothetical protein